MSSHPNTDTRRDNLPVLSVGELAQALKRHIEQGFDVVRVRGEITGCKRAASGHLYFSLKDADACLDSGVLAPGRHPAGDRRRRTASTSSPPAG